MTKCCRILISRLWWSDILKGKSDRKHLSEVLCFTRLQRHFNSPQDDSWIKFLWWWWRVCLTFHSKISQLGWEAITYDSHYFPTHQTSQRATVPCMEASALVYWDNTIDFFCLLYIWLFEQPSWSPYHLNSYLQCLYSLSLYWLIFFGTSAFKTTLFTWIFAARGMWDNKQGEQTL